MKHYLSICFGLLALLLTLFTSCGIKESPEYIEAFHSSGSTFGIFPVVSEEDISAEFILDDQSYWVGPVSIVDERHLISIKQEEIEKGRHGTQMNLLLKLNSKGTEKMAQYTEKNIDTRVAIFINDELIVVPMIKSVITDGYIRTTVNRQDGKSVVELLDLDEFLE